METKCVVLSVDARAIYGVYSTREVAQKTIAEWLRKGDPKAAILFKNDGCYVNNRHTFTFEKSVYHS